MGRPRLLDLFCGAGGCSVGYHRAGFEVVGVDIDPQPRYPFEFIQADVMGLDPEWMGGFDSIHASPPCQAYSRLKHLPWLKGRTYPTLIEPTRALLHQTGRPWVIENVMDAPLSGIFLCGQMFGLPTYRHRKFESNVFLWQPGHPSHRQVIGDSSKMHRHSKGGTLNAGSRAGAWGNSEIVTVAGHQFRKADGERALGIDWMHKPELAQAIPPAYTEFIGRQLLAQIRAEQTGEE